MTKAQKRLSPLQPVRTRCLDYSGTVAAVRWCDRVSCDLYPYRMGHLARQQPRRPLKAIKAYCLWCCDGSSREVFLCHPLDYPSREFRRKKNPARSRTGQKTTEALPHTQPSSHEPIPVLGGAIAESTACEAITRLVPMDRFSNDGTECKG